MSKLSLLLVARIFQFFAQMHSALEQSNRDFRDRTNKQETHRFSHEGYAQKGLRTDGDDTDWWDDVICHGQRDETRNAERRQQKNRLDATNVLGQPRPQRRQPRNPQRCYHVYQ